MRSAFGLASHLLAASAGAAGWLAGWLALRPAEREMKASDVGVAEVLETSKTAAARDDVEKRLATVVENERVHAAKMTRSIREEALAILEMRAERIRDNLKKLEDLQAIANGFRTTADLGVPLFHALAASDDEAASGIFLEWFRRDPEEAFRQLAIRRTWSSIVVWEDAVYHALPLAVVIRELARRDHPREFRDELREM